MQKCSVEKYNAVARCSQLAPVNKSNKNVRNNDFFLAAGVIRMCTQTLKAAHTYLPVFITQHQAEKTGQQQLMFVIYL